MRDTRHEILKFWFEETDPRLWFQVSSAFDFDLRARFETSWTMAKDGLCDHWADDPAGCLALCLLLSEFPRKMFRGTAQAFETDQIALVIARRAVMRGYHTLLPHEQRFFMIIPFERSENIEDHGKNLELFKAMETENPVAYRTAQRRFETIRRFGRYPDRNVALGRETTPDEAIWLIENIGN